MRAEIEDSVLVVVDIQPTFMKSVFEADRVVGRSSFLVQVAGVLGVPVLATTQYADRMGGLDPAVARHIRGPVFDKMTFSCCGSIDFNLALEKTDRSQVVLCGAETHICITQTAIDLLGSDYEVFVALDAVSSRSDGAARTGADRLRDLGAQVAHSESVVYEWLDSAEHPKFREVLELVKGHPLV